MDQPFDFRGLHCYPAPHEEGRWHFLPRRPDVQRGADGRPLLTLIDMGAEAYLLFTATWAAPADDIDALREEIALRSGRAGRPVALSFAPLASPRCDALMGEGRGSLQPVASSATSGFPPYDAAFNIHLKANRLEQARAALRGETGRLGIEYAAQLRVPVAAKAVLRASAAPFGQWMQERQVHDRASARDALEQAVEAGVARVVIDAPDAGAGMLAAELYDRVLDQAAELLPRLLRQPSQGDLQVNVEIERETGQATSAFADLGVLVQAETTATPTGGHDAAD